MNRINAKGLELMQYKAELLKDYPKLVKDSLVLSLEQMMESKVLDMDTYLNLKNDEFLQDDLEQYLLTKSAFTKTEEEIFREFEVLREGLNGKLTEHGIEDLNSESIIDKDSILLTQKFSINEAFTMSYFGVEEKDLLKLMKRRGFIEKFAVLRLTSIFRALMEKLTKPDEFGIDVSLVYFDKDENGYSIDFTYEIGIEDIEDEEKLSLICEKVKSIQKEVTEFYHAKMVF